MRSKYLINGKLGLDFNCVRGLLGAEGPGSVLRLVVIYRGFNYQEKRYLLAGCYVNLICFLLNWKIQDSTLLRNGIGVICISKG